MNKIQKVSLFFRIIFQICFIALPIWIAFKWIIAIKSAPYTPFDPISHFRAGIYYVGHLARNLPMMHDYAVYPHPFLSIGNLPIMQPFSITTKIFGFLINMIPVGVNLFILYYLIKLFSAYERGEIFLMRNVQYIKKIGYWLLAGQLLNLVYQALQSFNLTWQNPHGYRVIAVSVNAINISIVFVALLIILISWIMAEANKLQADHDLTI